MNTKLLGALTGKILFMFLSKRVETPVSYFFPRDMFCVSSPFLLGFHISFGDSLKWRCSRSIFHWFSSASLGLQRWRNVSFPLQSIKVGTQALQKAVTLCPVNTFLRLLGLWHYMLTAHTQPLWTLMLWHPMSGHQSPTCNGCSIGITTPGSNTPHPGHPVLGSPFLPHPGSEFSGIIGFL